MQEMAQGRPGEVIVEGKSYTLEPVEIESGQQPWCEIYLADGHKLRIQVNIANVWCVKGAPSNDGTPIYQIASALNVQALPRKKRK